MVKGTEDLNGGRGIPGKSIIVSAPSGAGKTTIVRHLLNEGLGLEFSVSATSRPMRANEVDGKDYFFLSVDEFRGRIAAGEFVEYEEVYPGRFYGTLRSELERIWEAGHHAIFDVDVVGGLDLKEIYQTKALALFVSPPSLEALEHRLNHRNTETPETLRMRVEKAEHEMSFRDRFDAVIVNDDRERACNEASSLVRTFLSA
ncbi:MAG: guanylate kinase [Flavobacteriales bacterium]|nr:guanylate kinase [Flavobacteriales bacterium]